MNSHDPSARVVRRPVAILGPWAPPSGGVATHVTTLQQDLLRHGVNVRLLAYGGNPPAEAGVTADIESRPRFLLRLARHVARGGVLHDHSRLYAGTVGSLQRALLAMLRAKHASWVVSVHDGGLPATYQAWPEERRRAFCRTVNRVAHLIPVNDELATFFARIGVSEGRISVAGPLLPGLLTASRSSPAPEVSAFIEDHSPVVLTVGSLLPAYDYLTVISAFKQLRAHAAEAGLVIATAGGSVDHEYGRIVEAEAGPLEDHVLHVAHLPQAELSHIMADSDVLVRGYRYESYGLSRVESLIAGTPVIATDSGEQAFVTRYEHGDPASLLTSLVSVLRGPALDTASVREHFEGVALRNIATVIDVYRSCTA